MTNTVKFPMNGFEDSCVGYGVAEHGTNFLTEDGLCPSCTATLSKAVAETNQQALMARLGNNCPGGCKDHLHGEKYFNCMCCYGD